METRKDEVEKDSQEKENTWKAALYNLNITYDDFFEVGAFL